MEPAVEEATQIPPPLDGVWTMNYIRELVKQGIMETRTFMPDETIPIGWNGVIVYVTRGVEIEVPKMHYDIYMDSRRGTMQAYDNARMSLEKRSFGPGQTSVTSGWNGNAQ